MSVCSCDFQTHCLSNAFQLRKCNVRTILIKLARTSLIISFKQQTPVEPYHSTGVCCFRFDQPLCYPMRNGILPQCAFCFLVTQSIRNRRERGSRFKMMFYVIGSEDQSRVLLSYCSRQQNQRRDGAVRYFHSIPMLCRIAPTSLLWVEHFYSVVM